MNTDFRGFDTQGLPLVSIVAVCYNHEKYLEETLDSIKAQTYPNIQLIIMDDCSQDGSVAKIEQWINRNDINCKFIAHKENQGLCKTLNHSIGYCKGKYFHGISCDDILVSEKTEKQVHLLEDLDDTYGMVCSNFKRIDEKGTTIVEKYFKDNFVFPVDVPKALLTGHLGYPIVVSTPTVLIKMEALSNIGSYDETLVQEDFDMWLRFSNKYKILYSDDIFVKYRVLPTALSFDYSLSEKLFNERIRVANKFLKANPLYKEPVLKHQAYCYRQLVNLALKKKNFKLLFQIINAKQAMFSKFNKKTNLGYEYKNLQKVDKTLLSDFKQRYKYSVWDYWMFVLSDNFRRIKRKAGKHFKLKLRQ